MHPIDRAAGLVFRYGPASMKVFRHGWGDPALVGLLEVQSDTPPPSPISIEWSAAASDGAVATTDGSFTSPAQHLPTGSRLANVRMIAPVESYERVVVLMAAWNDHGYGTRSHLAHQLARRGIAAAMLENPYYGSRRPWEGAPIRTVADFAVMGRAAVDEGRALMHHFSTDRVVGVAGYSMGGNIAALIGALMIEPVAIAALAASHSPGPVWLDGLINRTVDWEALGGDGARSRLRATLTRASVLEVVPQPHTAAAVIVGAGRDGYIPRSAVETLHAHWPGSELRWLQQAGHASMIWRNKRELVDAIEASFDRLEDRTESR